MKRLGSSTSRSPPSRSTYGGASRNSARVRDTIAEAVRRYIVVAFAMGVACASSTAIVDFDEYDFVTQCGVIECPLT